MNNYISKVPYLKYSLINEEIWKIIQREGLDEELERYNKLDWGIAKLDLTEEDKIGLRNFDNKTIEKFNDFDIKLKDTFHLRYIDIIDYENGEVFIITPIYG